MWSKHEWDYYSRGQDGINRAGTKISMMRLLLKILFLAVRVRPMRTGDIGHSQWWPIFSHSFPLFLSHCLVISQILKMCMSQSCLCTVYIVCSHTLTVNMNDSCSLPIWSHWYIKIPFLYNSCLYLSGLSKICCSLLLTTPLFG